jgi:hypothetical protein
VSKNQSGSECWLSLDLEDSCWPTVSDIGHVLLTRNLRSLGSVELLSLSLVSAVFGGS